MSSLERLAIMGVRSFDPHHQSVIDFFAPLTLIVGHNGSGKTTIIECLKYATTGDLPPGSKTGGSFVHDPKIAHVNEVKAKIKLKFHNTKGKEMVATRSIQASLKKTKLEQRQLEGTLASVDPVTGHQVSLSTKCAEIDFEIPRYLGTSKAILENVIFCHQEESNWPLAEPSVLKSKFDEIFAATKYTKALESIKKFRKDQSVELKLDEQELSHLKSNKDKAEKIRGGLTRIDDKVESSTAKIAELDVKINEIVEVSSSMMDEYQQHHALQIQVDTLRRECDMLSNQRNELRVNLHEYQETDQQLTDMLISRKAELRQAQNNIADSEQLCFQLKSEITRFEQQITDLAAKRGQYQAETQAHSERIVKRDEMIREISRQQQLGVVKGLSLGGVAALDKTQVDRFLEAFQQEIERSEGDLQKLKNEFHQSESEINDRLQSINSTKQSHEEIKGIRKKTRQENIRKLADIQGKLQDILAEETKLEIIRGQLDSQNSNLERTKSAYESSGLDERIRQQEQERVQIENQINSLNEEMAASGAQAETRARLALLQSEQADKTAQTDRLMTSLASQFETIAKRPLDKTADVQQSVDSLMRSHQDILRKADDKYQAVNNRMQTVDAKLSLARNDLSKHQERQQVLKRRYEQVCGTDDFDTLLASAQLQLEQKQEELIMCESSSVFYRDFAGKAKQNSCCPVCDQQLAQLQAFLSKIDTIISSVPDNADSVRIQIRQLKQRKEQELAPMQAVWTELKSLKPTIDNLQIQLKSMETEYSDSVAELEERQYELNAARAEEKSISALSLKAREIEGLRRDGQRLSREIEQLQMKFTRTSNDALSTPRTVEQLQTAIDGLQAQDKSIRRNLERYRTEIRNRQNEIQLLEKQIGETSMDLLKLEHRMSEKTRLQETQSLLQSENQKLEKELAAMDSEIGTLQPQLDLIMDERSELQRSFRQKEQDQINNVSKLRESFNRVDQLTGEIKRFIQSGMSDRIQSVNDQIENVRQQSASKQMELDKLTDLLSSISQQLTDLQVMERNIQDNLRFRKLEKDVREKRQELGRLSQSGGSFDTEAYKAKLQDLKIQQSNLTGERAMLQGEINELSNQKKGLERDLLTDYKDIEEIYRRQMIKVQTGKLANQDLEKYALALDNAIMRYHSEKMKEINKTILDLWRNTYQGNDIDTIEIRSDAENTRGNRSYNYRVVMKKGDVSLDMRGRSSAGQKVLTSLIIRLALAESFGVHCGILALDEPTTNLDRENISGLADSLNSIIQYRRQQRNFQLIIITHDEDFLRHLGKSDHADYYFRVAKNANQYSTIQKHDISDV